MTYTSIRVEDQAGVRTITLHRPEQRNAMTPEMQKELIAALEETAKSTARVLVLTGAEGAFCSGLDMSVLKEMCGKSAAEYHADAERIARMFMALYELPIPTIAAVHGAAIAGGAGLATICDFTVATPEAKFGFTEVRIGFVPALVSVFLALQIDGRNCRDLLLTGRIIGAQEAHRIGLVNAIVPYMELAAEVRGLAETLMANSPQSMAAAKRLLLTQNKALVDVAIEAAMGANALSRETADFREGVSAFLEKRKPVWSNESAI